MNQKQRIMLWRIVTAFVLTVVLQFVPIAGWWRLAAFVVVYIIIGYDIVRKATLGIGRGRVFDENFLMAVATLGAFALAIYERSGDYNEAIAVMLFYQVGEFFQSYAVGKSRRDIAALMDIRPDYANVEDPDDPTQVERMDPDDVEIGSIIVVKPGEKVPIDGTVREGQSTLNTSALTGESAPREVQPGDEIVSGCINLSGVLRIETTKEFGESTVSKILELMEDSASHKSQSEAFISRFARIYTPAVCYAALALAILPPLVQALWAMDAAVLTTEAFATWVYRALTFLVISCPCALVVSIPLSFFAGIGGASKLGVLVKGSNYLETLSKVRTVVFDKTGTLTEGAFEVTGLHHVADDRLLELAAHAECASSHPISLSLQRAYGKPVEARRVAQNRELSGEGIIAQVDGLQVAVGNDKLMHRVGAEWQPCHEVGTLVHVAIAGQYAGHIVISDKVKATSAEAIRALHTAGVERIVMLTGDARKVAEKVAQTLGIDQCYSELLPTDKVTRVVELLEAQGEKEKLAFVGDGINDAPVLSRADVGIAMGAMGSDAAIEAADVVLMDDDPLKVVQAISVARRTLGIVWQNICFALGVKGLCLLLGALGYANMWLAIFADVGVMVLCVLNAIRAMKPTQNNLSLFGGIDNKMMIFAL